MTSEKITIDKLLLEIQTQTILSHTETFKSNTQESILEKNGNKSNLNFTKIVKGNEYTTYLLLVNSYSIKNPYFMYYVITKKDSTEKAGYLKFIPDTPIDSINEKTFTGKIQMLDLKHKIRSESIFINGQNQKQTTSTTARTASDCTTKASIISHNCENGKNHSPGERCGDKMYYAYYEILLVTTCPFVSGYDNSGPVPNELMIGNNVGSGGSTPNYDYEINIFEQLLNDGQKAWWDNPENNLDKQKISIYLNQNPTDEAKEIASHMISQMYGKFAKKFDVEASLNSPMNIEISTITDATTEGAKFNSIYKSLTKSPEFKRLFLDVFKDSKRDNVKFEIEEHVYEDNDPTKKEVNATTSQDPVTKNLIIKISKQILIAGTTKSQTNIENAKTILHECIHAYLFVKANYPATGVDFAKILNSMYPTYDEQHDFMYNHMIPTMQQVLFEIRDLVTTAPKRANLEIYRFYASSTASKPLLFNWQEYYKYISLSGLNLTSCFKQDFPDPSEALTLHLNYIKAGKDELDR
ncbi:hypothetical protein [Flavobacterium sp. K5-23]|uniref:hypothetical protein n=1 Tax=Flavobacterium sp. K5-23 TaxID=2746225 RepID=UPI00200DE222|nr:hypothetical protein [Flavobacterium sp. K5-23]UQD55351.1 hypothetical protein FLAK523_02650 [Flavobacterium sp. K5-23]